MRITSKGQVTIPIEIRRRAGLLPNTEIEFFIDRDKVFIRKVKGGSRRGRQLIDALRGKGNVKMSTDEIMALTRGR